MGKPLFEWFSLWGGDGLDDAEQTFCIGTIGSVFFTVCCRQFELYPKLAVGKFPLFYFTQYCRGVGDSVSTATKSTTANHHSSL